MTTIAERNTRFLTAVYGSRESKQFTAAELLKSCAGLALQDPAAREIREAIVGLCGPKPNAKKLGRRLESLRDVRQGDLMLSGDYNTTSKRWVYCIESYEGGISADEFLAGVQQRAQERAQKLELELAVAKPRRALDIMERETNRKERLERQEQREAEHKEYTDWKNTVRAEERAKAKAARDADIARSTIKMFLNCSYQTSERATGQAAVIGPHARAVYQKGSWTIEVDFGHEPQEQLRLFGELKARYASLIDWTIVPRALHNSDLTDHSTLRAMALLAAGDTTTPLTSGRRQPRRNWSPFDL